MRIEAILSKEELEKIIADFCPLKLTLGDDGAIALSSPRDIELLPELGLRVSVAAEVRWPILGVPVPVTVRSAVLEVRPEILKTPGGDHLAFRFHLHKMDTSIFPAIVDRTIVDLVNKELEAKHRELSWSFTKTFSHVFKLPAALASAQAINLSVTGGQVQITNEAIVFTVSFGAGIEPRPVG